jgi:hypothetical protein
MSGKERCLVRAQARAGWEKLRKGRFVCLQLDRIGGIYRVTFIGHENGRRQKKMIMSSVAAMKSSLL